MHRTLFSKILVLLTFAMLPVAGQTKSSGEVDPSKCWAYPTGEVKGRVLANDGARVFIGLEGGKIEALSLDGKKIWSSDLGGEIRSNILPGSSGLLLVTATESDATKPGDNILRSLSKETGITAWTQKLLAAEEYFLTSSNGSIIVVSKNGIIEAIEAKDGTTKWKREIAEKFVAEPVFSHGKVTAATASQVFVVSLSTGEIVSMRKTTLAVTALGETSDGKSIIGDERGNVTLFTNGSDKPYWKFKSGGEISQATEAGGNVLAVSHDNFVYLLTGRNGSVIWKKRMPGRVSAATVYGGKYVVVSGFEEHTAVLLDLSKGKVAGQILLAGDETAAAIQTSASAILVLTDRTGYAFSLNGCSK